MMSSYRVGDVVVFRDEAVEHEFLLGTIASIHQSSAAAAVGVRAAGGEGGPSRRRAGSLTPRGGPDAVYGVIPELRCSTIPSKQYPGRELARATRFPAATPVGGAGVDAAAAHDGSGTDAVVGLQDIAELNERRLQLQSDIASSEARMEEIALYLKSRAADKAASRRRSLESAARAEKELLLARAQLRSAKSDEWRRLVTAYRSSGGGEGGGRALVAVVEAVLTLTGASKDISERELEKKVIAVKVDAVAAKRKKAVRKVEECLRAFPARTIPAERPLLTSLHRWLHAIVAAVAARPTRRESGATPGTPAKESAEDGDGPDACESPLGNGSEREHSPDPQAPTVDTEVDDEALRLAAERRDYAEYLEAAREELAAIDDLIVESRVALPGADVTLYVPAPAIAGAVPPSPELQEVLRRRAEVGPGEPVRLNATVGNALVELMTALRARPTPPAAAVSPSVSATVPSPSPRAGSPAQAQGSLRRRSSSRRPQIGTPTTRTATTTPTPPLAPFIAPLPLSSLKRTGSGFSRRESSPVVEGAGFAREDSLYQTLRDRVEHLNTSPRLPTPRAGAPLLESSLRAGSGSGHGFDEAVAPESAEAGTMAAQERLAYEQTLRELEIRLERALQANPKEAELQLLRDELKGTRQDLVRVAGERDTLRRELREKSQLSVLARRMQRPVEATTEVPDTRTEGSEGRERVGPDLTVVDELEEQLAAAHRRIQELEASYVASSASLAMPPAATIAAAAAAAVASAGPGVADSGNFSFVFPSSPSLATSMAVAAAAPRPSLDSSAPLTITGRALTDGAAMVATSSIFSPLSAGSSVTGATDAVSAGGGVDTLESSQQQLHQHQQLVQAMGLQLAQEQQARAQLQAEMEGLRAEAESHRRGTQEMEERLNTVLHARGQSQAQVAQQRRELEMMWSRLEEAEAQLREHQARERVAWQQLADRAEESAGLSAMLGAEHTGMDPALERPGGGTENELLSGLGDSDPRGVVPQGGSGARAGSSYRGPLGDEWGEVSVSRSSSQGLPRGRDASQSPQPVPVTSGGGGGLGSTTSMGGVGLSFAGAPTRAVSAQPVEHMSAVELRHEVRQLREEVERLQSSELRLSTELTGLYERVRDERRRRQQARTVRLQMLSRLQEVVQHTMETGKDMYAVSDIIERARQDTSEILKRSHVSP